MRRGVAYHSPSGWVLARLIYVFRLNRLVCWWPALGNRSSSGLQHRAGNDAKIGCRDVEPSNGICMRNSAASVREERRHRGGSSRYYDCSEP
jgi:hypothetical protein